MNISYVTKGGKVTRKMGNHLIGSVVHICEGKPENGWWGTPALCKAKPGKAYGWISAVEPVATCLKCQEKLDQMKKKVLN